MRKLFLLLFLLSAFRLSAQEEWYLDKPIADFAFTGLDTVSENELRPIVRPYIGEAFSLDLFWEIQEKMYALDYFESIESNALPGDEQKQSVIIEFRVVEKPTVSEIVLRGNRRIGRGEILDKILIKDGDMISRASVNIDADAVVDLYLEKGYLDARATGSIEPAEENTVKVIFEIIEGFQTTIREINFSGNDFASDSTLRRVMETKTQAIFSSGIFQESKFEEDIGRIQDYYGENGFIDARVEKVDRKIEKDEKEGRNYLILTIFIDEGKQYTYGGMGFEGNYIFSDKILGDLVRQEPGKILNKARLEADFQRVADHYYENGYIFNVINREEKRDENKKEITYTIKIIENDRAHIENIIIKGNEKTKDFVILREMPFEEGDIFSKKKVIQGLRNLYNLQYFGAIAPETPEGSAPGLMDLVINVEEGSTATINFGIMFSGGDYPVSGMLKWAENNFLGRGLTFGADLEISPLRQMVSVRFEEPWMFGERWMGGINLSLEHAIVPNVYSDMRWPYFTGDEDNAVPDPYTGRYVDPDTGDPSTPAAGGITDFEYDLRHGENLAELYAMDYELWKISAGLSTGYRFWTPAGWLGVRSGINTALEFVTYDPEVDRPFDKELRENLGLWSVVNKLGITLFWDNRDYFLNPTNGFYVAQGFTFAGGFLFGMRDYIRTDSTLEGFLTLLDLPVTDNWSFKMVLAAHSSISFILPQFGGIERTVPTDLLYIDGMNVARGWPLQKEKRALWDNRIELRIPLAEQILWWAFFLDGAAAWNEISNMELMTIDDFYFSLGGGIRFTIPQFPIRLYFAKRFQFRDGVPYWVEGDLPIFGVTLNFVISLGGDTF